MATARCLLLSVDCSAFCRTTRKLCDHQPSLINHYLKDHLKRVINTYLHDDERASDAPQVILPSTDRFLLIAASLVECVSSAGRL